MVNGNTRLMVGLDDLKGLFQPWQFYDCIISEKLSVAIFTVSVTLQESRFSEDKRAELCVVFRQHDNLKSTTGWVTSLVVPAKGLNTSCNKTESSGICQEDTTVMVQWIDRDVWRTIPSASAKVLKFCSFFSLSFLNGCWSGYIKTKSDSVFWPQEMTDFWN